jgi:integrase
MVDKIKLPYTIIKTSKGKEYRYYRRNGVTQRINGDTTFEVLENYQRIHASFESSTAPKGVKPGTIDDLIQRYIAAPEYAQLAERTRRDYRSYIEMIREPLGGYPVGAIRRRHVKAIRNNFADTPTKANNLVSVFGLILQHAIELEMIEYNPASKIKKLKTGPGWKAWPKPSLERGHELLSGSCRVAFMLALYTGQRKGDVLSMRWDDIQDGLIRITQNKTGKELWIPIHPTLADELQQVAKNGVAVVARRDGRPLTDSGFNRNWRRQQAKHGFTGLQFHGLRRNAVNALLEAGCEIPEVSSITGQSFEMVQHYAQEVNQKRLARSAMNKLETNSGKPSGKLSVVGKSPNA